MYKLSILTRSRMSAAKQDKKLTEDTKIKISKANSIMVTNCKADIFNSITEAAKIYNVAICNISMCCNSKRKTAGKYNNGEKIHWYFVDAINRGIVYSELVK